MKKKILIIGLVWPEPKSSAAGTRMLQLIELFQEQSFEITFASAAQTGDYSFDLSTLHIQTVQIQLNDSSFDEFVRTLNPSIVLFDRFISEEQFGWRVIENCPDAIRILDTEDLHCLRYARQQAIKNNSDFIVDDILNEDAALREVASIYRCDLSLIISDFEMELLQNTFKIDESLLFYLPMFYDQKSNYLSFKERKDFVFIGNFLHAPNYDAVLQLKSIWKNIKNKLPEAKLNVYGAYSSQKVEQLHNEREGFLIKGRAVDAFEVLEKSKVLLAPLRFGAGIKGKLLEAMVNGTPSITTKIGSEGIATYENWNGFICNDEVDFCEKAILTYTNENLWAKFQLNGEAVVRSKFNKEIYNSDLNVRIAYLLSNYKKARKFNFTGRLLVQNQFNSLKFMSKWIELKNSLNSEN
ncbi:MAG: glycosyltransferase family 4 protein [Limnohabitans sp.]|nr:glycosyltransferase family 4 protein [Limnohabitans sp.]